ncbi:MAG: 6-bladed beta-propeller [Gemmatimonadaceae bacterium]
MMAAIVDSTRGYPVVRITSGGAVWQATLLRRIGTRDGSALEFGAIRSVLMDDENTLYVVDHGYGALTVIDSAGKFIQHIGRKGAGPGEFGSPYSVAWLNDTLALLDPGNSRIGLFKKNGAWVGSWLTLRISGGQFVRLYRTGSSFWSVGVRPAAPQPQTVYVHYGTAGPIDTLPLARVDMPNANIRCTTKQEGVSFFANPYGPQLIALPTPNGELFVARSDQYRLTFLTKSGDTSRVVERAWQPVPITDDEWAIAGKDFESYREKWPSSACDRSAFERPRNKPPLVSAFYDRRGMLWVETVALNGPIYDVFDPTGRLLASVRGLPASGGIDPAFTDTRAAFVESDTSVTPTIQVYEILRRTDTR